MLSLATCKLISIRNYPLVLMEHTEYNARPIYLWAVWSYRLDLSYVACESMIVTIKYVDQQRKTIL
jgi:hypothetical protein